jgi:hypothetical protein
MHRLYVQERDDAGNWSVTGVFRTIVVTEPARTKDWPLYE